jgi:hypothetical protein
VSLHRVDIVGLYLEFTLSIHLYKRVVSLGKNPCGLAIGEANVVDVQLKVQNFTSLLVRNI